MTYTVDEKQIGDFTAIVEYDESQCAENPIEHADPLQLSLNGSLQGLGNYKDDSGMIEGVMLQALFDYGDVPASVYDVHPHDMDEKQAQTVARAFSAQFLALPVYCYQHGGIALSAPLSEANPFHCAWDSGMAGLVFISKAEARKRQGVKRLSPAKRKRMLQALSSIVESVGQWANGEVYAWRVEDADGETVESCCGYIGDSDYALGEAIDMAKWLVKDQRKARFAKLKTMIQNRVPLHKRAQLMEAA